MKLYFCGMTLAWHSGEQKSQLYTIILMIQQTEFQMNGVDIIISSANKMLVFNEFIFAKGM